MNSNVSDEMDAVRENITVFPAQSLLGTDSVFAYDNGDGHDDEDDQPYYGDEEAEGSVIVAGELFDPCCCCDDLEQLLIAAVRAYLRPECAPASLYERLRATLDHCCSEEQSAMSTSITSHTSVNNDGSVVRTTIVHQEF